MTSPDQNAPQDNRAAETVDQLIVRLRELQGSGEYPPLSRKVNAGDGLEGGGSLEQDVTLRLPASTVQLLGKLSDLDLDNLVTTGALSQATADLLTASHIAPRVYYRDFTVSEAPLATVRAPLIRVDNDLTITKVTVSVATPGSQSVVANVAGTSISVSAGRESSTVDTNIRRTAGQTIAVSVNATNAAGIVVSLRCEEAGTK